MIKIELPVLGTFDSLVTLAKTVLADVGGTLRAFSSRMTLLLADTAGALENSRLSTIGLGMAVLETVLAILKSIV